MTSLAKRTIWVGIAVGLLVSLPAQAQAAVVTAANWSGDVAPGTADVATFDATNVKDATINATISVAGINIVSTYTGIITQAGGVGMTIGTSGYSQAGGTFTGPANGTISLGGNLTISA